MPAGGLAQVGDRMLAFHPYFLFQLDTKINQNTNTKYQECFETALVKNKAPAL
jgi:hypothetical protein